MKEPTSERLGGNVSSSPSSGRSYTRLPPVFEVIDKEKRAILGEFDTREKAEAFKAELLAHDPEAEDLLIITSTSEHQEP